jgi:drug/metabolite transporter (DMT)-like permease
MVMHHAMPTSRSTILTCLAMLAFAGNSVLCRLALKHTSIDASSFTAIRLLSGAAALYLILAIRKRLLDRADLKPQSKHQPKHFLAGSWTSALALFTYAACFSFAYQGLTTATGALILFGSVQSAMIGYSLYQGEWLSTRQLGGLTLALGGLVALLLPGLSAPPWHAATLMICAGVAWAVYTLRGGRKTDTQNDDDPTSITAANFLRATPLSALLGLVTLNTLQLDGPGIFYAVLSGALASGVGYAIWYQVLPNLKTTSAATVQLSVPVIAAVAAVILLGEPITARLAVTATAILGGIALVISTKKRPPSEPQRAKQSL